MEIKIIAHKRSSATFTVPDSKDRKAIEAAIAERLRSDKELLWDDNPEVNVDCINGHDIWRPRRRFTMGE
jgi:hypothetical protein